MVILDSGYIKEVTLVDIQVITSILLPTLVILVKSDSSYIKDVILVDIQVITSILLPVVAGTTLGNSDSGYNYIKKK